MGDAVCARAAVALMSLLCVLVLSGCVSRLVTAPPPNTYDLAGPSTLPKVSSRSSAQVLVPPPQALKILDTQRVAVTRGTLVAYYPDAQYPDTLPKLLQQRIIEAFEHTKHGVAVGRPGEGLSIDYQLLTSIRSFNYVVDPAGSMAEVEISAQVMNDRNGRVVAFKVFEASVPVAGDNAPAVIAALNEALDSVLVDMVRWTLGKI